MQLLTISQLTRKYDVSPRTLRYYEELGLIQSIRTPDYAYRSYDEANALRLGQIVLLRKLRIPIRQIGELLTHDDAAQAIALFAQHVRGIDGEMGALDTLRTILMILIQRLSNIQAIKLKDHLFSDEAILSLIRSLPDDADKLKEVRTVSDLNQANATLNKLSNVRILYLPPATVAASHYIGDEPEQVTGDQIFAFARAVDIVRLKPDVRLYGFNHPNPVDETNAHGYEFWLTVPEDLAVPAPLVKKHFKGGLYAAHAIKMGDFHEWGLLDDWVRNNGEYVYCGSGSPENMFDSLEEHLNYHTCLVTSDNHPKQLDLLIPVKRREG